MDKVNSCGSKLCLGIFCTILTFVVLYSLLNPIDISYKDISSDTSAQVSRSSFMNKTKGFCNMEHLQAYMYRTGSFPNDAIWINKDKPGQAYLESTSCKLNRPANSNPTSNDKFLKCLDKKGISKIVVLGDSNGLRLTNGVLSFIKTNGFKCNKTKKERLRDRGFQSDPAYFTRKNGISDKDIITTINDCSGCGSEQTKCIKAVENSSVVIIVEYLLMEFFMDTEITTLRELHVNKNCIYRYGNICVRSPSHQMFLFKEYLANEYPQLLIVASPQHDINFFTQKEMSTHIRYFISLLDIYLPNNTNIIWLTTTSTGVDKLRPALKNRTFENNTVLEQQHSMNHILFSLLKDKLYMPNPTNFGFFDMFNLTLQIPTWRTDAAHFIPAFYTKITKTLFSIYCDLLVPADDQQ